MHFFQEFMLGLRAYRKAVTFIRDNRLYWYALIPALLMLGIYQVGAWLKQRHFTADVGTMNGIVWYLIQLMAELSIALLLMNFTKYLVVALLSPLLSYLSQKTEKAVTGKTYPLDLPQLWLDVRRGLRIVLRNILWEYSFFLIILAISTLGWEDARRSPVFYLTFLIGAFYYGFSFIDYVNERRRLTVEQSILFMRRHRGLAVSVGAVYSVLILVPVDLSALFSWERLSAEPLNFITQFCLHLFLWICAASAPILASIAATLAMHDLVDLQTSAVNSGANI
jgi:CysZ protein